MAAAQKTHSIPSYVLDDLSSRFIINSRPEETKSIIRIFFQIEIAHWFYLDFHRVENPNLPQSSIKTFANMLIKHCSMLQKYVDEFGKHFEAWRVYKRSISTFGAIILDASLKHVLLVQSYSVKKTWGFPKGKVNFNENPVDCAAREVMEETGFDIHPYVDPDEFFERSSDEQVNRLYIIAGVPLNTVFEPKTRREIRDIQWFPLDTLLSPKGDDALKELLGQNYNLFLVMPYLRELRKWVYNRLKGHQKKRKPTGKVPVNQKHQSVRYSRDMAFDDKATKQSRRTVGQSLFGNRETTTQAQAQAQPQPRAQTQPQAQPQPQAQTQPQPTKYPPVLDPKFFYSKSLYNFKLDVSGIISLLPIENPKFTISQVPHQPAIYK